jgi:4-amino-4-deoxy-L-arabinose transferase-like glycosyltransferase
LNLLYPSGGWEKRTETISFLLIGYGILFLILAVLSFAAKKKGSSLTARFLTSIQKVAQAWRQEIQSFRDAEKDLESLIFWPFLALLIGVGIRGYFLSQPMRGDEAFTFLNFVNKGAAALFDYPLPNNHVLNTLLIKISTVIMGVSPATIRFPAFLAGCAIIPLTFFLARAQSSRKSAGFLAALAASVFPYLILYATNARGYSLVIFLTLAIAFVALRYVRNPSSFRIVSLAIFSALGMWTIPSMVFGVAGIFLWIIALSLFEQRSLKQILLEFAIPFGFLSAAFTFILYTPVIFVSNGVRNIIANKFVESQSWPDFFTQFLPKIQSSYSEITRDLPPIVLLVGLVLILFGLYRSYRQRNWSTFLLLPCLFLGALVIVLFQHTNPYARIWIYTLPFIFILADYGLSEVVEWLPPRSNSFVNSALILVTIAYAMLLMSANVITKYPDTSAFPQAPLVAQYLKPILTSADTVKVTNTADWPVYFYFWYYHLPTPAIDKQNATGRTFLIVKKSRYSLADMTDKPVVKLLDFEDLALYQIVER